jgi:hypothetical protein
MYEHLAIAAILVTLAVAGGTADRAAPPAAEPVAIGHAAR